LSANLVHSIFGKKPGCFQVYETNLLDAFHWGDMIPPKAFYNFSLSSHRICQIIHL